MDKVLKSGAAEIAGECWYLPLFGVYQPRKPDQIRGVFDSSAIFEGVSCSDSYASYCQESALFQACRRLLGIGGLGCMKGNGADQ
jgi:hypothetical protein